jgi:hypothetical protein
LEALPAELEAETIAEGPAPHRPPPQIVAPLQDVRRRPKILP